MKLRSPAGTVAGLLATAVLATPAFAAPATVNVRVEGLNGTVIPRTSVTTTTTPVNKSGQPGEECTGTSAAGALEQATAGDWAGDWFGPGAGYFATRIRTESADPSSSFWNFWHNGRSSMVGMCGAELQPGDDVLLYVDCFANCAPRTPLRLSRVPATAAPGSTAGVLVESLAAGANGTPSPAAGATVTVGSSTFTAGADGVASVTFSGSGPVSLRAEKAGHVPTATESTCVTTGADGACGTIVPSPPDTVAPTGAILGIKGGQVFSRRRAPRELSGTVSPDPSGLWAVKIRLTRKLGKTCWYFSGTREQFLKRTCGKKYAFKVGDRTDWSYLLPSRLKRGRYVLDLYAIDNRFNKGAVTRVRFRVR